MLTIKMRIINHKLDKIGQQLTKETVMRDKMGWVKALKNYWTKFNLKLENTRSKMKEFKYYICVNNHKQK